jgi:hypothetical protein
MHIDHGDLSTEQVAGTNVRMCMFCSSAHSQRHRCHQEQYDDALQSSLLHSIAVASTSSVLHTSVQVLDLAILNPSLLLLLVAVKGRELAVHINPTLRRRFNRRPHFVAPQCSSAEHSQPHSVEPCVQETARMASEFEGQTWSCVRGQR